MEGIGTLTFEIQGLTPKELDNLKDLIDTLIVQKVFLVRDGSAELYFDDIGLLQKITTRKKRRRRTGENLKVFPVTSGRVFLDYDNKSDLLQIVYETHWNRERRT